MYIYNSFSVNDRYTRKGGYRGGALRLRPPPLPSSTLSFNVPLKSIILQFPFLCFILNCYISKQLQRSGMISRRLTYTHPTQNL